MYRFCGYCKKKVFAKKAKTSLLFKNVLMREGELNLSLQLD